MISRVPYQENDPNSGPYWDDLRSRDHSKSFGAVGDFIRQNAHKMRNPNKRRKPIIWALVVLLPLLVFYSCKRQTFIEPQKATLSFTANDSILSTLELEIHQFADKNWIVVLRPHAGSMYGTISAPNESFDKLKAFAEKLNSMPGVAELYLSAVSTTVKESPLSRLSYKIFNRHVDATGTSDEQLRSEIEKKLKAVDLLHLKLELIKENGKREVKLVPIGKTRDFSIDFTLQDGTSVTAIAEKW